MSLPPGNAKVQDGPTTQYENLNKALTAEAVTYRIFKAKTGESVSLQLCVYSMKCGLVAAHVAISCNSSQHC